MNTNKLIAFAQDLVRQPSPAGQEEAVVKRAETEMRALGYDRVWIDAVGNAIGVIEGTAAGPTLLFDAHCDTVGIAPGVPWENIQALLDGLKYYREYGRS